MPKKKTNEEFKKEIYDLMGEEYSVLDDYQGNKIKLEMIHNKCGHHFMTKPNVFLSGSRCPKCAGKLRKDTNYFKQEIFKLVGNEYDVIGEYIRCHSNVLFRHSCGNEFEMTPHSFLSGQRCPKCQHRSYKKTTEEFRQEIYNLVSDEYELIGKYVNNRTKVKLLHKKCGKIYEVCPTSFLYDGDRCCHCYGNVKKTQDEFERLVHDMYADEYTVLGKYTSMAKKIEIKHNICGNIWSVMPRDFIGNKSHCPECNYSKGEVRINNYLKLNNIENTPQMKYEGLVGINGGLLSYDFYLTKHNILLEYQGEFHDGKVSYQTEEDYARQKEHDRRKKQYCEDNDIKLLEIWYWEFDNIEEILNKELVSNSSSFSM